MKTRMSAGEKRYVGRQKLCHIGSADRSGRPHTAPVSHAFDERDRTLYVCTERGARTAQNLRARPRASVACDDYSDDWSRIKGVVMEARAKSLERGPKFERAVELLEKKFPQYRTIEIDYVIALRVEGVTSWGL